MPDYDPSLFAPNGGRILDSAGNIKQLSDFLGGITTTTRNHTEIHRGNFYTFGYTILAVADDGFIRLRFITGANTFHYGIRVTPEGKALAKIYRGTTYSVDGTEITPINNSCISSNEALLTPYHTPTIDVIGSELTPENGELLPGGIGPQSIGASVKSDEERIAATTQDYLVEVQNISGLPKTITIEIAGYEVA